MGSITVILRLKVQKVVYWIFILLLAGCSNISSSITPSPVLTTKNVPAEIVEASSTATETTTPSPTMTALPTFTSTVTSTTTPTPTLTVEFPTPTFSATLTLAERNARLLELLKTNAECELPCIWGIVPGETKWDDAYRLLFHLGDSGFEIPRAGYNMNVFEYQNFKDGYTIATGILAKNNVIDIVSESPLVYYDSPYLEELWEQFSLRSLMTSFGPPSRIWVTLGTGEYYWPDSTHFDIWLFYDQIGLLITYYDVATRVDADYRVCPNQQHFNANTPLQLYFWTQEPGKDRSLEEAYKIFTETPIHGYQELHDAVGLEVNEFYDLIVQGGSDACFSTPREIWP